MEASRPRLPRRAPLRGAPWGYWIARYAPQDLASGGAMLVAGLALRGLPALWLVSICALVESVTFYGVSFVRQRRGLAGPARSRRTVVLMLREYGLPEALDLVVRPLLMAVAASGLPSPLLGIAAGSAAADLLFYAQAGLLHRVHALA